LASVTFTARSGYLVDLPRHREDFSLTTSEDFHMATDIIAQGEHPKVIADRLGHTSVRTVLDVYGHLYEGADQAAAQGLEQQINSRSAASKRRRPSAHQMRS
jgi:integrase